MFIFLSSPQDLTIVENQKVCMLRQGHGIVDRLQNPNEKHYQDQDC